MGRDARQSHKSRYLSHQSGSLSFPIPCGLALRRRAGRAVSSRAVCGRRAYRTSCGPRCDAGNNPCSRQADEVVALWSRRTDCGPPWRCRARPGRAPSPRSGRCWFRPKQQRAVSGSDGPSAAHLRGSRLGRWRCCVSAEAGASWHPVSFRRTPGSRPQRASGARWARRSLVAERGRELCADADDCGSCRHRLRAVVLRPDGQSTSELAASSGTASMIAIPFLFRPARLHCASPSCTAAGAWMPRGAALNHLMRVDPRPGSGR
jgi:hypothetical protein